MKDILKAHKGKIVALTVAALTGFGLMISPELGAVIAEALDMVEQIILGISVEPTVAE